MGYHLTILRTCSGEAVPITESEFADAAARVASLQLDEDRRSARYLRGGELRSTLTLADGEVWTNTAEEDVLAVMLELAAPLNARVRGDDGESYRSINETYVHPDDADDVTIADAERPEHQRRRLFWNVVRIAAVLLVLGLIIANALRK